MDLYEQVWRFVRGDTDSREFEAWLYSEPAAETELGSELYLATISANYGSREEVWRVRQLLGAHARRAWRQACRCLELPDEAVVDMGQEARDMLSTYDEVRRQGGARWWLSAARCRECGQGWLVGAEERHNDVICLVRLDPVALDDIMAGDHWPHDFDNYEVLLQMGASAGRSASFVDPLGSRSLGATVSDLVQARPEIADEELTRLLNLHVDLVRQLRARVKLPDANPSPAHDGRKT